MPRPSVNFFRYCFVFTTLLLTVEITNAQSVYYRIADPYIALRDGKTEWVDIDSDNDLDLIYCGRSANGEFQTYVYESSVVELTLRNTNLPAASSFTFGDYDNDGDQDMLANVDADGASHLVLLRNDGGFSFTQVVTIDGLLTTNLQWFDFDNDEDLDFILTGNRIDTYAPVTRVYKNIGSTFTEVTQTGLPNCSGCAIEAADANGDGYIDIMFTGNPTTDLYLAQGNGTFVKYTGSSFMQLTTGDVRWGDFDGDGDLDLLLCGSFHTSIYENRNSTFVERSDIPLLGMAGNSGDAIGWFNFDNAGLPDIFVTGTGTATQTGQTARIYKNNGGGSFTEISDAYLRSTGLHNPSIDAADFDNDGDTDLAFVGAYYYLGGTFNPHITSSPLSGYFRNTLFNTQPLSNTKPMPPAIGSVSEKMYRNEIRFKWEAGSDAETPAGGLFYNFYLRNDSRKIIVPSVNFSNGYRLTNSVPNGSGRSGFVSGAPEGLLYFAVQSIDGSKAGSDFSPEKIIYHFNGPEATGSEVIDTQQVTLKWIDHSTLETSFEISRSLSVAMGFAVIDMAAQNSTSYTDNNTLVTETLYYYRFRGVNDTHTSPYDSITVVIPERPTGLAGIATNAEKVKLTWTDHSQFETGFQVERKKADEANFVSVAELLSNIEEYEDTSLQNGTTYNYRVRAVSQSGGLTPVEMISVTTNHLPIGANLTLTADEDTNLKFTKVMLEAKVTDVDVDDKLMGIKLYVLPLYGKLYVSNILATVGQVISTDNIDDIEFRPNPDFAGETALWAYPYDGKDYSTTEWMITLHFNPINDPPVFSFPAVIELMEDFPSAYNSIPSFHPPPDELSQPVVFSLTPETSDLVEIVSFNTSTGAFVFKSLLNAFGSADFTLTSNDGQATNNTHSLPFKVVIRAVADPPLLGQIAPIEVELSQPIPPVALSFVNVDENTMTSMFEVVSSTNPEVLKPTNIAFKVEADDAVTMELKPEKVLGKTNVTIRVKHPGATLTRTFSVTVFTTMAVEDDHPFSVEIYPNPVVGEVNIELKGNRDPLIIWLIDSSGRVIVTRQSRGNTTEKIDVPSGPGFFLLRIEERGKIVFKKILQQ